MDEWQLTEIEARVAATPPGPWQDGRDCVLYPLPAPRKYNTTGVDYVVKRNSIGKHLDERALCRFIAAAREDVPALIAEVRRLQALREREGAP